jgi:hypothetical protein
VFWALGLVFALASLGWMKLLVRRNVRTMADMDGLVLAGIWFALLCVSLVRFMTITPAATGRLLFPGIAALALFLALGLEAATPRRWSDATLGGVGVGLLALSIASPFCAIAPLFAPPLIDSAQNISGEIPFDDAVFDAVRLLGAQVDPDEAQAGDTVDVTLYWETQATPPADLRVVVRLWTMGGRLVGQRDAQPTAQVYPPDLWRAGDIVRDVHRLPVGEEGPAMCRVSVSVLIDDELLGEVSSPGMLKLTAAPIPLEEIAHPVAYTLGDQVELIGYDIAASPSGETLDVTLYWHSLSEMDQDYVVFVHLLDEEGGVYGQGDGPPLTNDYATSYWAPGEVLADEHTIALKGGLSLDAQLLVGLYRGADGVRLPAYDAAGERVPDDAIRLDPFP